MEDRLNLIQLFGVENVNFLEVYDNSKIYISYRNENFSLSIDRLFLFFYCSYMNIYKINSLDPIDSKQGSSQLSGHFYWKSNGFIDSLLNGKVLNIYFSEGAQNKVIKNALVYHVHSPLSSSGLSYFSFSASEIDDGNTKELFYTKIENSSIQMKVTPRAKEVWSTFLKKTFLHLKKVSEELG